MLEDKKYSTLRDILVTMNPSDIAGLFDALEEQRIPVMYRLLPKEVAAEVFVELDTDLQQALIQAFSDAELEAVFSDPDFYAKHGSDHVKLQQELETVRAEAARLYERWEEL